MKIGAMSDEEMRDLADDVYNWLMAQGFSLRSMDITDIACVISALRSMGLLKTKE